MREVDILIHGGRVLTMAPDRHTIADGAIAIADGRIVDVGETDRVASAVHAVKAIDARGRLVLPGLVDVHLHNTQQLSRGLADDVDLITWVYDRILPYEACLNDEDTYLSTMLTAIAAIRTGTTCTCDPGGYLVDNVARAYEEVGLRGVVSWAGMDQWPGDRPVPDALPGKLTTAETLEAMERVVRTWDGQANGRLRACYGLRTEPNVSPELFRETKRLADRDHTFIHMHTAVSQSQVDWMRAHTGYTSIEYLEHLGVLDGNWLLAHVAAVSGHEVDLLAKRGAKIAHQPGASLHGAYGVVSRGRIPEMLEAGITVGLGCDANSADNSLDMFRAMFLAATVHKEVRGDATLVSPERALELATIDGARAIGWDDEIGSLEVGKRADVIVVDMGGANWVPVHDFSIVPTLVYSGEGSDVLTTIVDGQVLMEGRRLLTVDERALLDRAQAAAEAIVDRLPYRLSPRWRASGKSADS